MIKHFSVNEDPQKSKNALLNISAIPKEDTTAAAAGQPRPSAHKLIQPNVKNLDSHEESVSIISSQ